MVPQVKADNLSGSEILYPTDDASIWMEYPNNNYGSSDHMGVRNRYGHPTHQDHWEVNALIRFDLSSIPPGTPIISARLCLYYYGCVFDNCEGRDLACYRITSDWNEGNVTWNTRHSYTSEVTSFSTVPPIYRPMCWDVTSDVQAFVNGEETNHGWEIMDTTTWRNYNVPDTRFRTKEYGVHTYLAITLYEDIPTLTEWGLVILVGLIVASAIFIMLRKRKATVPA